MHAYTYHSIEGTYPHGDDTSRDTDVAEGVTNDLEAVQWVMDKVKAQMHSTDCRAEYERDADDDPYGDHVFGISIQEGQRCVLQLMWDEDKYVSVSGYYNHQHQQV